MIKSSQISEESINLLISNELNTNKFETVLSSVIHEQTFTSKNLGLNRNAVVEKILNTKQLRDIENEIVENILRNNIYKNKDKVSYENDININLKMMKNKNNTTKNMKTGNNDLESFKLINLLFDELLQCNDHLSLENYLGDLANFKPDLISRNEKIHDLIKKIDNFLENCIAKDEYLSNNLINILSKITSSQLIQTKVLIDAIIIFSFFLIRITDKFYKVSFDISRFYKISVNFECLNNMIGKLHTHNISLKKVESSKIKQLVDNYITLILFNYDEKTQLNNNLSYGISSNYVMIILFCLDNDLVNLKILFRNCHTRNIMISNLDKYLSLIFIDHKKSLASFCEKSSFIWKHNSVLEQIYTNYKINKRFLHYAFFYIQINFLGLIIRYRKSRERFYYSEENINNQLDCSQQFENLLSFLFVIYNKNEFNNLKELEEYQQENLFYLIKEVCCDFILYCYDSSCIDKKKAKVLGLYNMNTYEKKFKFFLEYILEAFKENVCIEKKIDSDNIF